MKKIIRTPDFPIVETKLGKLHGFKQDEVYHFHGIRYGTAQRFELPEMEKTWEGIRDAKAYGYVCPLLPEDMQPQIAVTHDASDMENPFAAPFNSFEMPHIFWPMDEQCLYLNVWTKHLDTQAKRPVFVWLHGGGFGTGSSIELPAYDGTNFTDFADVVFVSLNHRLNCLGFLDLSSFGDEFKYSGIAGMADIVLALEWVRDNIAFFGGDPDNVTVAGQSGGGGKACALLQMPAADGLFHKVISQSGALGRRGAETFEEEKALWQELGRKTVQNLGLDEHTIDRIRSVSYEELSAAAGRAGQEMGLESGMMLFNPAPVEGYYIGSYKYAGFRPETADIPLISGTVIGEFNALHYLGNKDSYTENEKLDLIRKTFGDKTQRILELFQKLYPGKDPLYSLSVDFLFRPAATEFLNARTAFLSEQGKNTKCWDYMVSCIIPYMGGLTLFHCGDIPFVFRNLETETMICTAHDFAEDLRDRMSEAWAAFIRNSDPSTPELAWPPYTRNEKIRMIFDRSCAPQQADDTELLQLMSFGIL